MKRHRGPDFVAGTIASDGTPIDRGFGKFGCQKIGVGVYDVYFSPDFKPLFMLETLSGTAGMTQSYPAAAGGSSPNGIRVGTYNTTGGAIDAGFNFIAVGIQQ